MNARKGIFLSSLLLLASCSLLSLPFQLISVVFKGLMTLVNAIINLGSAAASQAVKLSPYALLFASAETNETSHENPALVSCDQAPSIVMLHEAIVAAPQNIRSLDQALSDSPANSSSAFLLDPTDLLMESREKNWKDWLGKKRIVSIQWVHVPASTDSFEIKLNQ